MPALKDKRRELFCQHVVSGMTASAAYAAAGYKADDGNAARMRAKPDVVARIEELSAKVEAKVVETVGIGRSYVIEQLRRNAEIAMGDRLVKVVKQTKSEDDPMEVEVTMRDAAAANKALELIGKELGMFSEPEPEDKKSPLEGIPVDRLEDLRRELVDERNRRASS
jgi:phage terminase small subunit